MNKNQQLYELLENAVQQFNRASFIADDPIGIPHRFSKKQDIEITAFWTAMLAWGNRKTIINSANELVRLMDGAPHDFLVNHQEIDRKPFLNFKHRTFQATDTLWFLEYLQRFYQNNHSLETAFVKHLSVDSENIEPALIGFHKDFFLDEFAPNRTRKHVATPERGSTCKRLCMFFRWMVRQDSAGVDFGIWKNIRPHQLLMPLDVHVERVGRRLGLLEREKPDWRAVLELTENLRQFDPKDPVKYDFALFGLGVSGEIF
jgi:uncharacterized protein (TIGR02757 family)